MSHFAPELILEHSDRAHLVAITAMPGFVILHKIMRSEVDKFVVAQINANPANETEVLAAHRMARAAAQFYQGVTNQINEQILQYSNIPSAEVLGDVTEALIDLGDIKSEEEISDSSE